MRVASLVPSATESLRALGVEPIACTRFCEQPDLPTVGGTKDPDVDALVARRPDLVVVNDEENRREDADALVAAGLRLYSMSPRSVEDVGPAVAALARAVGVDVPAPFDPAGWRAWIDGQRAPVSRRCAVLLWRRPWTTLRSDTYGSSLLALLGFENVFADMPDRYPTTTLEDLSARRPDVVLLPNEPYPFKARHVPPVEAAAPGARVALVDGRDLFWWGTRTPAAIEHLRAALRS